MGDGRRDGDDGGRRAFRVRIAARELLFGRYHGSLAGLECREDGISGLVDEDAAISVEGPDIRGNLSLGQQTAGKPCNGERLPCSY